MALTAVLLVALFSVAWLFPVPYVAMSPGPTEDVLGTVGKNRPVIEIEKTGLDKTDGKLDLTTVSATPAGQKLELLSALEAWIDPDVAVVPRSYLYPDNKTPKQVNTENAEMMTMSQEEAIAAALRLAGEKIDAVVVVSAIQEGAPALGKLKAGDIIVSVDGKPVGADVEKVGQLVGGHRPGDKVVFSVRRNGKAIEVPIVTTHRQQEKDKAAVGITAGGSYNFPFKVKVNLGQDIGGPSAGSMFALGIYDKLTPGSLTGGKHIAGTGTINSAGKVGPIGGIQQKIIGARDGGATVFMVPADNCPAAADAGISDIRLIRVENLAGAVKALNALNEGKDKQVPAC